MKTRTVKFSLELLGSLLMICSLGFILANMSNGNIDRIVPCAVPFTAAGALMVFYSIFFVPSDKKKAVHK